MKMVVTHIVRLEAGAMKILSAVLLVLIAPLSASAEVRLSHLFGDHMILQQQTNNAIWGLSSPGEKVTVTASWGAEQGQRPLSR